MHKERSISKHKTRNLFTRDFILGFFAIFAFAAANQTLTPTLPIYLTRLGSSEREIGILIGIAAVASLGSRLFVGGALLKYREKSVMMIGALLSAITFLAFIVFRPFWPFLAIRFFQGVAMACIDTAALAAVINVIPLVYRARALGYFMLAPSLAMAIGAPSGMFIINQYGFTTLFLSGAILSFCALFMSWKTEGQEVTTIQKAAPTRSASFFDAKIVLPAIISFLQLFVWGAVSAFFPLYAIQCGVKNPGPFFSAMAIMMIAGRMFGGRIMETYPKAKLITAFLPFMVFNLLILSFSKTLSMFIVVGAFWGVVAAFFVPVSMTYAFEYSGSSDGAAVGTFRAISDLGLGIGPVVVGIIIPFTGYRIMFLCLAFICLINLCYFQFYVRKRGVVASSIATL